MAIATLAGGKNLFDQSKIIRGYLLNSSGQPTANNNYSISEYIPATPNTPYTVSGGTHPVQAVCFYDSQGQLILYKYCEGISTPVVFFAPANTAFLRFSYWYSYAPTLQLERGNTATSYEPFQRGTLAGLRNISRAAARAVAAPNLGPMNWNLCPPPTAPGWEFKGGAYLNDKGEIVIPKYDTNCYAFSPYIDLSYVPKFSTYRECYSAYPSVVDPTYNPDGTLFNSNLMTYYYDVHKSNTAVNSAGYTSNGNGVEKIRPGYWGSYWKGQNGGPQVKFLRIMILGGMQAPNQGYKCRMVGCRAIDNTGDQWALAPYDLGARAAAR